MVDRHQRRETDMHIFEVIGAGTPPITVFARSYDEAVRTYMARWLARETGDLPDIEVRRRDPLWAGMDREALAEALSLGISGIGHFDPDKGWAIVSPTHVEEEL
jgi:hypothetical protein